MRARASQSVQRGAYTQISLHQHPTHPAPAPLQALFAFLEGSVERQLKRLYPIRPDRADAWLSGEIARAATDPGALGVFRSVFYLPRPRPLSYLVGQVFGGPTLVLQVGWRLSSRPACCIRLSWPVGCHPACCI